MYLVFALSHVRITVGDSFLHVMAYIDRPIGMKSDSAWIMKDGAQWCWWFQSHGQEQRNSIFNNAAVHSALTFSIVCWFCTGTLGLVLFKTVTINPEATMCVFVCLYYFGSVSISKDYAGCGLELKWVLSYACTHLCRRVCLKWRVYMPLVGIRFWGCTCGGVYVPCIYSYAGWEVP